MAEIISLSQLVRAARRANDLNQDELSNKLDFTYNVVSKWENEQQNGKLRAHDWMLLVKVLGDSITSRVTPELQKLIDALPDDARQMRADVPPRIEPEIGGRLRNLRNKHKLTLVEVGEKLRTSAAHVSRLELGQGNPTIPQLRLLTKLFDTTYEYLLDGVGEAHESLKTVLSHRDKLRRFVHSMTGGKIEGLNDALGD